MNKVSESIERLREALSFYAEENISSLSDAEAIDYANQRLGDLEFENSLYAIAIQNNIMGGDFDKWFELAAEKYNHLKEGEEIDEAQLLDLLKQVKN